MGLRNCLAPLVVVSCFVFAPVYGQLELIEVGGPVATPAIRVAPPPACASSSDVPSFAQGNIARGRDHAVGFRVAAPAP